MSSRIPDTPPVIKKVLTQDYRPLWSVMIPTYNCIDYLRQTLEGVLCQDPGPEKMQIEVVDDHSSDGDVYAVVKEVGKGRVSFFQQKENVGHIRNFETCINRSKGYLMHLLHGDDVVKPGFYEEMESLFEQYPKIGAAFIKNSYMDENGIENIPDEVVLEAPGIVQDFLFNIAQRSMFQVVAMVVKRSVYEHLGGFYGVSFGEDWEMWARIAAHYSVAYSPKCLAIYRGGQGHATSITSNAIKDGQNIRDINKVIDIMQSYLPTEKRKELRAIAKKNFSMHYAEASHRIYHYSPDAAFAQANGALKMHLNIRTIYWVMRLYLLHAQQIIARKVLRA